MSWSKVTPGPKPVGWWYHKLAAEFWYLMDDQVLYYHHLFIMIKRYKLNIYGEKL